jgi:hypothetical protein
MNNTWSPSSEELELLSTSDEEIRNRHQSFCFHLGDFTKRISSGDRWQQLIQAHLYFEHVVAQILTEALAKPEAISLSRMGFGQRLDLVVTMALLPDEVVTPIRKLSSLRNKIAHDLTFEVSDSDIRDLENCTPVHLREVIQMDAGRKAGSLELHELLKLILFKAEITRQESAGRRELVRKAELRLRTVLENTPNVKYVR